MAFSRVVGRWESQRFPTADPSHQSAFVVHLVIISLRWRDHGPMF